jgi:hypothetical protein
MKNDVRYEKLIAQHIDVALVYKEMLGLEEARAYLERANIPRDIAERVLVAEQMRPSNGVRKPPPAATAAPPLFTCRRKNRVHDAIVEAALKLERKCGTGWALALLREERVPEAVAARILAHGPRQLRTRRKGEASVFIGNSLVG